MVAIDNLVERLRTTESRSKRDLLDESAFTMETMKIHLEYLMEHPEDHCIFCSKKDADCKVCEPDYIGITWESCG